jgi:hypothetical protein
MDQFFTFTNNIVTGLLAVLLGNVAVNTFLQHVHATIGAVFLCGLLPDSSQRANELARLRSHGSPSGCASDNSGSVFSVCGPCRRIISGTGGRLHQCSSVVQFSCW